ncbi:hypothetical protein RND71_001508 [Anisodus tanguticus]|uniref:C2 domain-containing protein n=1 Tax=Anisodus tanguticus TaxID=243964 RepID=A0AAE1VVX2_9SOLA|nr:hypothetical protein RND71_001508 [Anisodus tanguticus]
MHYFYVRVVKAKELPLIKNGNGNGNPHPFVEVQLRNLKGLTLHFEDMSRTQADEAFQEALHLDDTSVNGDGVANIKSKNVCPSWNEDLMCVVAEPFEDQLVLSVEDKVAPNKGELLGKCVIPLQDVEKKVISRQHPRVVETKHWGFRTWNLECSRFIPNEDRDGHGITDPYSVAKYGQKWIRTRTILNSFNPKWNEQYTWEVFDPCTVITIGVFHNCHLQSA